MIKFNEELIAKKMDALDKFNQDIFRKIEEQVKKCDEELAQRRIDLDQRASKCIQKEKELLEREGKLAYQENLCKNREELLKQKENDIEADVLYRIRERIASHDAKEAQTREEIERLRNEIHNLNEKESVYDQLKTLLNGRDPVTLNALFKQQKDEINNLRISLFNYSNQEHQKDMEALQSKIKVLELKNTDLEDENQRLRQSRGDAILEYQIEELKRTSEILKRERDAYENSNRMLMTENERLTAIYGTAKNREDRIKDVTAPYITFNDAQLASVDSEIEYVDSIIKLSADAGIKFPKRIVYAFHTCLKTAEWSPITVLAGVSGTGKSELPRFYSNIGKLNFLSVPVQPNWDSQEAMLGYFNSIDNRFDAQPILRFLAQAAQSNSNEYPYGLRDAMNLVLLDEMNLAHVELYFADFLSKLETRRGLKENLPCVDVKLGAGITPYGLELSRNVLWVEQ